MFKVLPPAWLISLAFRSVSVRLWVASCPAGFSCHFSPLPPLWGQKRDCTVLFAFNFLATLLSHLAVYPEDALVGSIMQYRSKMNTLNVGSDYLKGLEFAYAKHRLYSKATSQHGHLLSGLIAMTKLPGKALVPTQDLPWSTESLALCCCMLHNHVLGLNIIHNIDIITNAGRSIWYCFSRENPLSHQHPH